MHLDELQAILHGGETLTVEFKGGTLNDTALVEAVACLANASGGKLLVGVTNDGRVEGARPRHGHATFPNRVEALVAAKTNPAVPVNCSLVNVDSQEVLVVEVPTASQVIATTDGRYLRRSLDTRGRPQCLPMAPHEILARAGSISAQDYSRVAVVAVGVEDLSSVEFDRYRSLVQAGGDNALQNLSNIELLRALNLVTSEDTVTVGAVLLFGDPELIEARLPQYEVGFQELNDLQVITQEVSPLPLLRAMIEMTDRVKARNPEEELQIGLFRVGLPRFADEAVRETIANALVHRDYTSPGPTMIELNRDALVVSNPGGLPEGVNVSNILSTPPRARNPALADAFKRAGLVERTGRGVNRAFASQLALGRSAPDYSRSTHGSVVVRMRTGPADREFAGYIAEARQEGQDFTLEELLALHEVRTERRITSERAAELFQVAPAEARVVLNRLAERGLVEARGERKGRTYHLSAALYRRLGNPADYVRVRGFEDIQHQQMVLTFVRSHGRITRSQAADLCQLDPARASRLLRSLRDQGHLELVGKQKGAHYIIPPE